MVRGKRIELLSQRWQRWVLPLNEPRIKKAHCVGIEPTLTNRTESNRLFGLRAIPVTKTTVD